MLSAVESRCNLFVTYNSLKLLSQPLVLQIKFEHRNTSVVFCPLLIHGVHAWKVSHVFSHKEEYIQYNSNTFAIKCTEPEAGHVNVGRLIFKPSLAALVGGRTYTKEGVEIEKHQPVTN